MMFNFNFFSSSPSFSPSSSTHPKYTQTAYPPALSQYLPKKSHKRTHDEMNGSYGYWVHPEGPSKPTFRDYWDSYTQKLRKKRTGVRLNHETLGSKRGSDARHYRRTETPQHYTYDYGYEDEFRYQPPYQPTPVPQPEPAQEYYAPPQQGYYGVRTRHKIAKAKERARYPSYSQYPPPSAYYMGTQDYPSMANLASQRTASIPVIPAQVIDLGYEEHGRRKLRRVGRLHRDDHY